MWQEGREGDELAPFLTPAAFLLPAVVLTSWVAFLVVVEADIVESAAGVSLSVEGMEEEKRVAGEGMENQESGRGEEEAELEESLFLRSLGKRVRLMGILVVKREEGKRAHPVFSFLFDDGGERRNDERSVSLK